MDFDCSTAPALLGHPDAKIVACGPFHGSSRLQFVWLDTPAGAVKRLVLLHASGEPFLGRGLAAAGRFLEEGGLHQNKLLDEQGALFFIKFADARPPGWTEMEGVGTFPGIGTSSFQADPFRLTLIRQLGPSGAGGTLSSDVTGQELTLSGQGYAPAGPTLHQRATLARSGMGGVWEWTIEGWNDGEWEEQHTVPLK